MGMVTYLNEYPTALLGGSIRRFWNCPKKSMITVMRRPSEIVRNWNAKMESWRPQFFGCD